jgi:UDP-N-acetylmuramoyl-tripeptide--D-alanyl-D-alanine ligase
MVEIGELIGIVATTLWSGYYLITNLQWYNYYLSRVLFHHHRPWEHLFYFIFPIVATLVSPIAGGSISIVTALLFFYRNRKGVTFTGRVTRFFIFLIMGMVGWLLLLPPPFSNLTPFLAVVVAYLFSSQFEKLLFLHYYRQAQKRLAQIDPIVIGVTGSYGKTSIKNFIYQLLAPHYKVYKTPKSVNTLKGIVKDINTSLPEGTQIYIVEMGARRPGDIREIVELVRPHYSIMGRVGPQHLDYFRTLERVQATKREIFESDRLKGGFALEKVPHPKVTCIAKYIGNIESGLEGSRWELEIDGKKERFFTPVLGGFQVFNISLSIYTALQFLPLEQVKLGVAHLKPVPHRLQPFWAGGKFIIDDSFNGNLEGMIASFEMVREWKGKKVVVTPGLVEVPVQFNREVARKINEIFDLAIVTGRLNREILMEEITIPKVAVNGKEELERVLAERVPAGSLVLFSNDFPDYL